MTQPAPVQLAVSIVSLAVLHAISVWVLFNIPRPNWTIAGVLSWAFGWICVELQDPNELIISTFVPDIITGVAYAAFAVGAVIIPSQVLIRLVLLSRPKWNAYKCNSAAVVAEGEGSPVEEDKKEEELKQVDIYGDAKDDDADVEAPKETANETALVLEHEIPSS